MMACFRRYRRNESPAHRPFAFMTSKGTPLSKYSRVEPILMPCPCRGSRPAARAAFPTLSRNFVLVRDLRACLT